MLFETDFVLHRIRHALRARDHVTIPRLLCVVQRILRRNTYFLLQSHSPWQACLTTSICSNNVFWVHYIILLFRRAKWFHLSHPPTREHVSKSIHHTVYIIGWLLPQCMRGIWQRFSIGRQQLTLDCFVFSSTLENTQIQGPHTFLTQ
jgi:hypothetical protein